MVNLVLAVLFIGAAIVGYKYRRGFNIPGSVSLVPGAIAAIILVFSIVTVIPAGHVGVVSLFGKVSPSPLYEGINLVSPLVHVTVMSTQVQKHNAKYDSASRDLQAVHVEMIINYRVLPEKAPEIYQRIGRDFVEIIINPAAQEVLKANTALHVVSEILHQRPKIKDDVQVSLAKWLVRYGIELKEASLANIRFDPAYEKAIEAKQIEEQKAEQKRYELIQAQRQAEIVAAEAKGKADALKIRGQAEAEYNQKVSSSLSPILVQQQYLTRWDGKLPQYMLGNNTGILLQIPNGKVTGEK